MSPGLFFPVSIVLKYSFFGLPFFFFGHGSPFFKQMIQIHQEVWVVAFSFEMIHQAVGVVTFSFDSRAH